MTSQSALEELLRHPEVWRPDTLTRSTSRGVSTGFVELDECLPGGGWPRGALSEILVETPGAGELALVLPAIAALSRMNRWIALVGPPLLPYPPALASWGVELGRLLLIRGHSRAEHIWAAEQSLRSGACAAVALWSSTLDSRCLRRLQLAAESGDSCALLFRETASSRHVSPAALRLKLEPHIEGPRVEILKCRGARAGKVIRVTRNS